MKKIVPIILLAFIFSSTTTKSKDHEFEALVVFGDSLSDVGNRHLFFNNTLLSSKVVAGDGLVYNEYLAPLFTGKPIYPAILGGTNYALSNATVSSSIFNTADDYGERHLWLSGNNLYLLWGGGNDLAQGLLLSSGELIAQYIFYNLKNFFQPEKTFPVPSVFFGHFKAELAALDLYIIARGFLENGAKYVLVPNLFDVGLTPQVGLYFYRVAHTLSFQIPPSFPLLAPWELALVLDYQNLYNEVNLPTDTTPGSGARFVKERLVAFTSRAYGPLAPFILFVVEVASETTRQFNQELKSGLESIDGNVVYLDIYTLVNELIDNPRFYGFDDIVLPACGRLNPVTFANQLECKGEQYQEMTEGKNFLWSDLAHPGPWTHLIFAQYMASVFNAPVMISSIPRHLLLLNQNHRDEIANTLFNLDPAAALGYWETFASLSGAVFRLGEPYDYQARGTNTTLLNLGATYGASPKLIVGGLLSLGTGISHPYADFNYRYNSQILSLVAKYSVGPAWWMTGALSVGRLQANQINRGIVLGYGKRTERGKTNSTDFGVTLASGYDWHYAEDFTLTPYLQFSWSRLSFAGFAEDNNLSTSMRYGKNKLRDKEVKVALRFTKKTENTRLFAEVGMTEPIHNSPIKIKSGLKNTRASFVREIKDRVHPHFNFALGLKRELQQDWSLTASINYARDTDKNQRFGYTLGLSKKF